MSPAPLQTPTALGPRLAAAAPDVAGYARHKAAERLLLQRAASRRSAMADRLEAPTTPTTPTAAGVGGAVEVEAGGKCRRAARVQQGLQRARTLPKSSSAACDADKAPIAPDWATRAAATQANPARGGAPPDSSRAASKAPLSARARFLPCSHAQDCRHSHGNGVVVVVELHRWKCCWPGRAHPEAASRAWAQRGRPPRACCSCTWPGWRGARGQSRCWE